MVAVDVKHEEFADRVGRRLDAVAERLEGEARRLDTGGGHSETKARVQEMRMAQHLVRQEAVDVGREEREAPTEKVAENLSLEAQG